jgi:hypothetical protein
MNSTILKSLLVAAAMVTTVPAFADILSTTGSVEVTAGSIAFYPLGGNAGDFNVGPPDTGIFATLPGTSGMIMNLSSVNEPINTIVNVPDFMTFTGDPGLSFTLTELLGGTLGACPGPPPLAGQSCTPPGTPYNLTNLTPTSSTAGFSIVGYVVNSAQPGVQTPFSGIFTTQFANESLQQVLASITTGGTADATYSAQFITSPVVGTPEPGTMLTFLAGGILMLGIGTFGKKLRASKRV